MDDEPASVDKAKRHAGARAERDGGQAIVSNDRKGRQAYPCPSGGGTVTVASRHIFGGYSFLNFLKIALLSSESCYDQVMIALLRDNEGSQFFWAVTDDPGIGSHS